MVKDATQDLAESTERVVMRAKAGDKDAFRVLYSRYAANVHAAAMRVVGDQHDAEDVTQQVFTKLMTSIDRYEDRGQPFHHWLARVARNAAVDHVRRRRSIPVEDPWAPDTPSMHSTPEALDALRTALAGLPEDQRRVLLLRHLVGLSPEEIAERTGRTAAAVHGLHFRARRRLTGELRGMGLAPTVTARRGRFTRTAAQAA